MKTDPPESWHEFWVRVIEPRLHPRWTLGEQQEWIQSFVPEWKQQEKEKAEYRKQCEREAIEHERAVDRLKAEIEREKNRIAREERQRREREMREEQRDPTPNVLSASSIPRIPDSIRDQHIFVPGISRHGKSSVLFHLIMHDIVNNVGIAVLDPIKGDLVKLVCAYLPENRLKDVLYIDLSHTAPLNLLKKTDHPEFLVGDIKKIIIKENATLERAGSHLTNLIYALLSIDNTTFMDIRLFFTNADRQKQILDALKKCPDPYYYELCRDELAKLPRDHWSPITTRMTDFTANPNLREVINKPWGLDLRRAMDEKKIILVNLAGTGDTPEIYGQFLMSQFQQAAYSRNDTPPYARVPFNLYADEFHEFQNASLAKIISIGGGLQLRLTLATQYMTKLNDDVLHAVLHVGSYIIFKLGEHVNLLSRAVYPYLPYRIELLPKYQAIYKIGDEPPAFHCTKAPPPYQSNEEHRVEQLIPRLIQQTRDYIAAQSGTNGTNLSPPCASDTVGHTDTDDKPDPEPGPAVPVDQSQTKRP